MPTKINSRQNSRIKEVVKLTKRRQRDERRATLVEGNREVERALGAGVTPIEAYICPELCHNPLIAQQLTALDAASQTPLYEVTPDVFEKIAYREKSGGVLLVVPYFSQELSAISQVQPTFIAIVEGVEKPGNLGAILRTADGAGVDVVIVCSPPQTGQHETSVDVHNPNAIRASLGTIFHVPLVQTTTDDALTWLHEQKIQIVATTPDGAQNYTQIDMRDPTAVVMGSEAHGLSDAWLDAADRRAMIPMNGIADSLNLSTSAALLLYEVVRQREDSDG